MLQLLNCCFGFAQGFQVEIVLVFLFVLLAAQRQGFIEFILFGLRLLHAFTALAQALLQRLIAGMQRRQLLAQRAGPGLLLHGRTDLIRRQRQRVFRHRSQPVA